MPLARRTARAALPAVFFLLLLALAPSCRSGAANGTRTYQAIGRIVSIGPFDRSVTIQHEDIAGYMSAMTMGFPVLDPKILHGLAPDDRVRFELTVTEHGLWVSKIERIGPAPSGA
jgi:Cu/Ag efflux protein CusF